MARPTIGKSGVEEHGARRHCHISRRFTNGPRTMSLHSATYKDNADAVGIGEAADADRVVGNAHGIRQECEVCLGLATADRSDRASLRRRPSTGLLRRRRCATAGAALFHFFKADAVWTIDKRTYPLRKGWFVSLLDNDGACPWADATCARKHLPEVQSRRARR